MDRFDEILNELGRLINVPLHTDKNRVCRLIFNKTMAMQIEYDAAKEKVYLVAMVCDIPPGRFRENVCREALKANNYYPRIGTLAYSDRHNKLALFETFSIHGLTAEKLAPALGPFVEKANFWRANIEKNTIPVFSAEPSKKSPSIFDIKP